MKQLIVLLAIMMAIAGCTKEDVYTIKNPADYNVSLENGQINLTNNSDEPLTVDYVYVHVFNDTVADNFSYNFNEVVLLPNDTLSTDAQNLKSKHGNIPLTDLSSVTLACYRYINKPYRDDVFKYAYSCWSR